MSDEPNKSRPGRFPVGLDQVQQRGAAPASRELLRPQRHLQQAQHALQTDARQASPRGLGMDSESVRARMVQRLRADGAVHESVLQAMLQVHRHQFVDSALAGQAYEDTSLPIGLGQTISKPSVVARMLSLLFETEFAQAQGHLGRVLEIGTGCGYQAALLCRLSTSVVSVERLLPLHEKARLNLAGQAGAGDLRLVHGDGRLGHAPKAPYQSIVCAAGGDTVPEPWVDQLAEGGRLVAPMHDPNLQGQVLVVMDKTAGGLRTRRYDAVRFVPLKFGKE